MAHVRTSDDFLITQLLEETYQTLPARDDLSHSPDLSSHFDKHAASSDENAIDPTLENFLSRQAKSVIRLKYCPTTGCYRFSYQNQEIDLPGNWGPFEGLGRELVYLNLCDCELGEILCSLCGEKQKIALVGKFAQVDLAFFAQDDEFSLRWLEKYFSPIAKNEAA